MTAIRSDEYTHAERKRHGAAYNRLLRMIESAKPDASALRRELGAALAAGFPIDWPGVAGNTLLHWTAVSLPAVRAGLLQVLVEAGADVNIREDDGDTPLDLACWGYVVGGAPEYLASVSILLAGAKNLREPSNAPAEQGRPGSGARPESDEKWKVWDWREPEERRRRRRLAAYIDACLGRLAPEQDEDGDASAAFSRALKLAVSDTPQIDWAKYTAEERERHDAVYKRLLKIIASAAPDAEFRRALDDALAAGFPIDWQEEDGWTLLHYAVNISNAVRAGLPQILIAAGAKANLQDNLGWTPLGRVCWQYVWGGAPEYLAAINFLLAAGAWPELSGKWKDGWTAPKEQARRDWLAGYIETRETRRAAALPGAGDTPPGFDYAM